MPDSRGVPARRGDGRATSCSTGASRARPVTVLRRGRDQIAIASGVREGERVALQGAGPGGQRRSDAARATLSAGVIVLVGCHRGAARRRARTRRPRRRTFRRRGCSAGACRSRCTRPAICAPRASVQLTAPPMGGQLQIVEARRNRRRGQEPATWSSNSIRPNRTSISSRRASICARPSRTSSRPRPRAAVQAAEDEVALLHARYDVRRAELTRSGNELVSAIEAKQNLLLLDEAKQRLAQLEPDVKTPPRTERRRGRRPAREAQQGAAVGAGRRAKHRQPADPRAVRRLRHACATNTKRSAASSSSAWRCPTSASATRRSPASRSPTSSTRRISRSRAKLPSRIARTSSPGQPIDVAVDAVPDASLHGTVRAVSGVAVARHLRRRHAAVRHRLRRHRRTSAFARGSARDRDRRARRTTTCSTCRAPRFSRSSGKPTVYVRTGQRFDAREVEVRAWTDSRRRGRERRSGAPKSRWSIRTRRPARGRRQPPRRRAATARVPTMTAADALAARSRPQRRQPAAPQAAHAADDARHDLRRRRGAVACCRSAPARSSR